MKPAAFDYHRAHDVTDAVGLLTELAAAGDDPKLIAGGQSLMPMMSFRLARPTALVDLGGLRRDPALSGIRHDTGGSLTLGSLTTHRAVETSAAELGAGFEVLATAMRWVGHLPIRSRGTVGGSIVHGDATAEWCLLARLLDAVVVAEGPTGVREIPAEQMFHGFYVTEVGPEEVVTAIRFTRPAPHAALTEYARRHGDFAIVNAAVSLDVDLHPDPSSPRLRGGRVVLGGVGPVPVRVPAAEAVLAGGSPSSSLFLAAGEAAAAALDVEDDAVATADYRRRLTRTLVSRALAEAWPHADAA